MPFDPNLPFEVVKPTEDDSGGTVVQDNKMGDIKYAPDYTPADIEKDVSKLRTEKAKIDAALPQLTLRQKFENAPTSADKMKVLTEFAYAQGVRGLAPAAGYYLGGRPGMITGGVLGEAAGRIIEGQPITGGSLVKAGIESAPIIKNAQLVGNALRLAGVNVAGEAAEKAIDRKEVLNFEETARAATRGPVQALVGAGVSKALGGLSAASKEIQRRIDEKDIIEGLTQANQRGYIVDPVKYTAKRATDAYKSKIMEKSGGQDEFQKAASLVNEPKVMMDSREAAGATADMSLNREFFLARKYQASEPYRQMKAVSDEAKNAVDSWMDANADAGSAYRMLRESTDPATRNEARKAAKAAQIEADAAFDKIMDEAKKAGNPKLVERLQKARIEYAQIMAVESATNRGTGKPDARVYGEMWKNHAPLTGPLETLGRIGSIMPEVVTPASEFMGNVVKKTTPSNSGVVGMGIGAAAGLLGSAKLGVAPSVGSAIGTAAGYGLNKASAAVPPLLQQLQMSQPYQAANLLPRYMDEYPGFKSEFMRFAVPNL